MKISADLIFTGDGRLIPNGIIETNENGVIIEIYESSEEKEINHFEGIITPGFFNSHVHLELAGAKFKNNDGFEGFLLEMKNWINNPKNHLNHDEIKKQDKYLYDQGINFCADISNTEKTIQVKKQSKIKYVSFLEIYESLNDQTKEKFENVCSLKEKFSSQGLFCSVVPHSFYALSDLMVQYIKAYNSRNKSFSTIHFKEQMRENNLYQCKKDVYSALNDNYLDTFLKKYANTNIHATMDELFDHDQRVLVVHGIYMGTDDALKIHNDFMNSALCICPSSNLNLENRMADAKTVKVFSNRVFLGTDSQASNSEMNFLKEMFLFQEYYNESVFSVLKKVTSAPAEFFECSNMGKIKPGNNPGLNLITNIDLDRKSVV